MLVRRGAAPGAYSCSISYSVTVQNHLRVYHDNYVMPLSFTSLHFTIYLLLGLEFISLLAHLILGWCERSSCRTENLVCVLYSRVLIVSALLAVHSIRAIKTRASPSLARFRARPFPVRFESTFLRFRE